MLLVCRFVSFTRGGYRTGGSTLDQLLLGRLGKVLTEEPKRPVQDRLVRAGMQRRKRGPGWPKEWNRATEQVGKHLWVPRVDNILIEAEISKVIDCQWLLRPAKGDRDVATNCN